MQAKGAMMEMAACDMAAPMATARQIVKEGLSEYFLYTIEGTETLEKGWSKRLPSFDADQIPVENLYKYEEERYGSQVMRFLSFKNDKDHKRSCKRDVILKRGNPEFSGGKVDREPHRQLLRRCCTKCAIYSEYRN